jgi:hypothetical protein
MIEAWGNHAGNKKCVQNSGRNPEGKRPFSRPGLGCKIHIKVDLNEIR